MSGKTYFISYTEKDEHWATRIAEILEKNGVSVLIQAWDIHAGDNFVLKMNEFLQSCDVCVPIISQEYLASAYCKAEWTAAFAEAAKNPAKQMIPVRIMNVKPDGLLKPIVYIDLFGIRIQDEVAVTGRLLEGFSIITKDRKASGDSGLSTESIDSQFSDSQLSNNPLISKPYVVNNFNITGEKPTVIQTVNELTINNI